jgi:HlyD family type I secretion membrane fusion protein
MADIARPSDNYQRLAKIGFGLIIFTFGILGLWAAFAPLSSAVVGSGTVTTESNKKTIQHLEGGIVRKIMVHEGDHVQAGQVLFELDPVQANAGLEIVRNQLFTLLARADRLNSERSHFSAVRFSPEVLAQIGDPVVRQAVEDEKRQFHERLGTVTGQVEILESRVGQYREQIEGIDQQRASMEEQVGFLTEELSGLNELYSKNLVPKPRLLALEGQRSQIKGGIGRALSEKAQAQKAIGEAALQARQIRQQFDQDIAKELADIQVQTTDLRERYTVASDTAKRVKIVSPVSGTAQNLRFFTEGAVVRSAEPMVEIAPDKGDMVIHAQFSPTDVDSVHPGMVAELRFSSFHDRSIPIIMGKVSTISQDRLVDEASHTPYFLVIVNIKDSDIPAGIKSRLKAGMPAEVVVPTGKRSALEYIFNPLTNALHRTMREK